MLSSEEGGESTTEPLETKKPHLPLSKKRVTAKTLTASGLILNGTALCTLLKKKKPGIYKRERNACVLPQEPSSKQEWQQAASCGGGNHSTRGSVS